MKEHIFISGVFNQGETMLSQVETEQLLKLNHTRIMIQLLDEIKISCKQKKSVLSFDDSVFSECSLDMTFEKQLQDFISSEAFELGESFGLSAQLGDETQLFTLIQRMVREADFSVAVDFFLPVENVVTPSLEAHLNTFVQQIAVQMERKQSTLSRAVLPKIDAIALQWKPLDVRANIHKAEVAPSKPLTPPVHDTHPPSKNTYTRFSFISSSAHAGEDESFSTTHVPSAEHTEKGVVSEEMLRAHRHRVGPFFTTIEILSEADNSCGDVDEDISSGYQIELQIAKLPRFKLINKWWKARPWESLPVDTEPTIKSGEKYKLFVKDYDGIVAFRFVITEDNQCIISEGRPLKTLSPDGVQHAALARFKPVLTAGIIWRIYDKDEQRYIWLIVNNSPDYKPEGPHQEALILYHLRPFLSRDLDQSVCGIMFNYAGHEGPSKCSKEPINLENPPDNVILPTLATKDTLFEIPVSSDDTSSPLTQILLWFGLVTASLAKLRMKAETQANYDFYNPMDQELQDESQLFSQRISESFHHQSKTYTLSSGKEITIQFGTALTERKVYVLYLQDVIFDDAKELVELIILNPESVPMSILVKIARFVNDYRAIAKAAGAVDLFLFIPNRDPILTFLFKYSRRYEDFYEGTPIYFSKYMDGIDLHLQGKPEINSSIVSHKPLVAPSDIHVLHFNQSHPVSYDAILSVEDKKQVLRSHLHLMHLVEEAAARGIELIFVDEGRSQNVSIEDLSSEFIQQCKTLFPGKIPVLEALSFEQSEFIPKGQAPRILLALQLIHKIHYAMHEDVAGPLHDFIDRLVEREFNRRDVLSLFGLTDALTDEVKHLLVNKVLTQYPELVDQKRELEAIDCAIEAFQNTTPTESQTFKQKMVLLNFGVDHRDNFQEYYKQRQISYSFVDTQDLNELSLLEELKRLSQDLSHEEKVKFLAEKCGVLATPDINYPGFNLFKIIRHKEINAFQILRPQLPHYVENKNCLTKYLRELQKSADNLSTIDKQTVKHVAQLHPGSSNARMLWHQIWRVAYSQFLTLQEIINNPDMLVFEEGLYKVITLNDMDPEEVAYIQQNFSKGYQLSWATYNFKQKFCLVKYGAPKIALALNMTSSLYPTIDEEINSTYVNYFESALIREEQSLLSDLAKKHASKSPHKKIEFLCKPCVLINLSLIPPEKLISPPSDCLILSYDELIIANQFESKKLGITEQNRADVERLKTYFSQPIQIAGSEALLIIEKLFDRTLLDYDTSQKIKLKAFDNVFKRNHAFIFELRERLVSRSLHKHMSEQQKPGLLIFGAGHKFNFRWANIQRIETETKELFEQMILERFDTGMLRYIVAEGKLLEQAQKKVVTEDKTEVVEQKVIYERQGSILGALEQTELEHLFFDKDIYSSVERITIDSGSIYYTVTPKLQAEETKSSTDLQWSLPETISTKLYQFFNALGHESVTKVALIKAFPEHSCEALVRKNFVVRMETGEYRLHDKVLEAQAKYIYVSDDYKIDFLNRRFSLFEGVELTFELKEDIKKKYISVCLEQYVIPDEIVIHDHGLIEITHCDWRFKHDRFISDIARNLDQEDILKWAKKAVGQGHCELAFYLMRLINFTKPSKAWPSYKIAYQRLCEYAGHPGGLSNFSSSDANLSERYTDLGNTSCIDVFDGYRAAQDQKTYALMAEHGVYSRNPLQCITEISLDNIISIGFDKKIQTDMHDPLVLVERLLSEKSPLKTVLSKRQGKNHDVYSEPLSSSKADIEVPKSQAKLIASMESDSIGHTQELKWDLSKLPRFICTTPLIGSCGRTPKNAQPKNKTKFSN